MKKKTLTVAIVCVMLVSLLSSCGGGSGGQQQATTPPTQSGGAGNSNGNSGGSSEDEISGIEVSGDTVLTFGPFAIAVPDGWELEDATESDSILHYFIVDPDDMQGTLHAFVGDIGIRDQISDLVVEYMEDLSPNGIEEFDYDEVELDNGIFMYINVLFGYDEDDNTIVFLEYGLTDEEEIFMSFIYTIPEDVFAATDADELTASFASLQVVDDDGEYSDGDNDGDDGYTAGGEEAEGIVVTGNTVLTFGPFAIGVPDGWELEDATESDSILHYFIADPDDMQGTLHAFVGEMDMSDQISEIVVEYMESLSPNGIEEFDYDEVELDNGIFMYINVVFGYDEDDNKVVFLEYGVTDEEEIFMSFLYTIPEDVFAATDADEITASFASLQVVE